MKYIDAERLRAAIKEHTLFYAGQANLLDGTNTLDGYDEVLAIIDSLQQEQSDVFDTVAFQKGVQEGRRLEREEPVSDCHDLKKAAEEYASRYDAWNDDQDIAEYAFKAGAEWQKKQDEENYAWVKQLPNPNIEKLDGIEITTSDSSAGGKELLYVSNKSYNIGLRDGMAEQKRKMMEGAVVARVSIDELSCGLYNLCVEAGITSETDTTIIILPKED